MAESPNSAKFENGPIILLGLGYTTGRLASRLLARRAGLWILARNVHRYSHLAAAGIGICDIAVPDDASRLPRGAVLVHTIPPLPESGRERLRRLVQVIAPRRIVYISSTSVYGSRERVSAQTEARATEDKGGLRLCEESWIARGPWSTLILRPAAIYGPGRGVHARLREGKLPRGAGSGAVSRIHVDDLVAVLEAGVFSDLEGAWPVADRHPCSSAEIVSWCARLMNLQGDWPVAGEVGEALTFPMAGRTVDGRRVLELLGVELRYPTYEAGIAASLVEEKQTATAALVRGQS